MAKGFKDKIKAQNSAKAQSTTIPSVSVALANREVTEPVDAEKANAILTEISRPELQPDGQIVRVPIDEVYAVKQVRPEEDFEEETLENLKNSYSETGLLTPPRCFPRDSRGYRIWFGETRWRSMKRANEEFIDIYVGKPPKDDKQRIIGQLNENLHQSGLRPLATAESIYELKTEFNMTGEEIAAVIGKKPTFVSKHLKLVDTGDYVKALLRDKITADLELVYNLSQIDDLSPEVAETLSKQAREKGLTRAEVKNELNRLKGKPAKGKDNAPGPDIEPPAPINFNAPPEIVERGAGDESVAPAPLPTSEATESLPAVNNNDKASSGAIASAHDAGQVSECQVMVMVDGQKGQLLIDRVPDQYGFVWVRLDIGEMCVEANSVSLQGIKAKK